MNYYSCHYVLVDDAEGELVDAIPVCSDHCHREYCESHGLEYGGWYGCAELEHDTESHGAPVCSNCGGRLIRTIQITERV